MCGIAGVIRYGKTPITEEQIALLLVGNEHRGADATGIALQDFRGDVHILKADCPAWKFVKGKEYEDFIKKHLGEQTRVALMHTRGASQGNPRDGENNHPLYNGVSAVIHNGSIKNDDTLFKTMQLDRKAAADTDIIRAIVDKWGITPEGITNLNRMTGSMASAAVHPKYPGKVLLMRSGAPMTIASTPDQLLFASEKNTLHHALRPYVTRFGIPFQVHNTHPAFSVFPDHTAWILGEKGKEGHFHCKTLDGQYHEPWRKTYEEYSQRQEKFNREHEAKKFQVIDKRRPVIRGFMAAPASGDQIDLAWCTKCSRDWTIPAGADPTQFECNKANPIPGCGNKLVALPQNIEVVKNIH